MPCSLHTKLKKIADSVEERIGAGHRGDLSTMALEALNTIDLTGVAPDEASQGFVNAFVEANGKLNTHEINERALKHLRVIFENTKLAELTADDIEGYLRRRLKQRVQVKAKNGFVEKGLLKATTVHPELRVLGRMLNVAVRKKFLFANPCSGVEFPARVEGLFRPHYVTWSEQQKIEFSAPEYLRNVIRIVTETGLRIYKELTPMKKEQVDLENQTVWIPDSKTPNGIAEVPLTEIAVEAFRKRMALSGSAPFLFPSQENPDGYQKSFKTVWHATLRRAKVRYFAFTIFVRRTLLGSALVVSRMSG